MESVKKMFQITPPKDSILNRDIHKVFRLPISYVGQDKLFDLNPTVANDLELTKPPIEDISGSLIVSNTMYEHLFKSLRIFEFQKHFE